MSDERDNQQKFIAVESWRETKWVCLFGMCLIVCWTTCTLIPRNGCDPEILLRVATTQGVQP